VKIYLTFNLLMIVGALFSFLLFRLNQRFGLFLFLRELKLNYALLTTCFSLALLQNFLPAQIFFEPPAKIWSGHKMQIEKASYVSVAGTKATVPAERAGRSINSILIVVFLFGSLKLTRDLYRLTKIKTKSFQVKRVGRVAIYASETIHTPFSHWIPFKASVTVPTSMLGTDWRIAVLHELQHHRQNDTQWVYALWFFRTVCFWNPAIYLWSYLISEIQELACDESLVGRSKISPQVYASCLIRVAETSVQSDRALTCATGLSFRVGRYSLTRRIHSMFSSKKKSLSRPAFGVLTTAILTVMVSVAIGSQNLVQDRRVAQEDAEKMLQNYNGSVGVVINESVLKQLNRYIGTPEGRDFMKASLGRMQTHKSLIEKKIIEYGVPKELIAIPITESGYENLPPNNKQGYGAGLWMFIKTTAQRYRLKVEAPPGVDERLDIEKETDAAMRYLSSNQKLFKSWDLAILAYNIGENAVQKGINKTGSTDVWTLLHHGYENDKDYFPKLIAAILIMNNPAVLD
jgi:membrane-bound lytic murein transglycosylase D